MSRVTTRQDAPNVQSSDLSAVFAVCRAPFKNMVGKPIGIATLTAKGVYRRRQTLVAISILEY